jgi:hypothetical protein
MSYHCPFADVRRLVIVPCGLDSLCYNKGQEEKESLRLCAIQHLHLEDRQALFHRHKAAIVFDTCLRVGKVTNILWLFYFIFIFFFNLAGITLPGV